MSGGFVDVPDDPFEELRRLIEKQNLRLDELEKPTGTQVAETVASQISPVADGSSAINFAMSTSYLTKTSLSVTVPDGFTRAVVVATGSISAATGSGAGDRLFGAITIGGDLGPEAILALTVDGFVGTVAPSHTVDLSGLSGGGSVSVVVSSKLALGPNNALFQQYNTVALAVVALFLR